MHVPAHIIAPEDCGNMLLTDQSAHQILDIAQLPGIQDSIWVMPNTYAGHDVPIGTVAATDIHDGGIISPSGIGYDITCGIRLLTTNISAKTLSDNCDDVAQALKRAIPAHHDASGSIIRSSESLQRLLTYGLQELVQQGYGTSEDVTLCEEQGCHPATNAEHVSHTAVQRGLSELGTRGSGSHFIELQEITDIYDDEAATAYGIQRGMIVVMIHAGSGGLGHEITSDYISRMSKETPDAHLSSLAYALFHSDLGQTYYAAMVATANYAWSNRHMLSHAVRTVLTDVLGDKTNVNPVYDISHNTGRCEQHKTHGYNRNIFVHRKGAVRAFSGNHHETPAQY